MNWQDRITVDPKVLVGKPVIKGTRIAIELLLELRTAGPTSRSSRIISIWRRKIFRPQTPSSAARIFERDAAWCRYLGRKSGEEMAAVVTNGQG